MITMCNAIQVDPTSDHVAKLLSEYRKCQEELSSEQIQEEREMLLETLNQQYALYIQKDRDWDQERIDHIKVWLEALVSKNSQ